MNPLNRILAGTLLAAGLALPVIGAENIVIPFNDASDSTFSRWWGNASQTYEHDATVDVDNNAASGSQKMIIGFNIAANGGDNQFAAFRSFSSVIDARDYTNLTFYVRFDPASPVRPAGNFGNLEFGLGPTDFSQINLGTVAVPTTETGWYRVSVRLDPTVPKMDAINRFWVKIWSGTPDGLTGTTTMWLDNITLNANTNTAPPPPPSIAIQRVKPGLHLFTTAAGGQYGRQSIYTVGSSGYSWVGASGPVTYSLTISDHIKSGANFQTHMFLVPGSGLPTWENSPDWNEPNLVFLDIGNNADGSGYASFRYKTNLPNGNTMVYNADTAAGPAGTIATIGSPKVAGTWSVTFNNNTQVALTAPNGAVTNFTLPNDAAAMFADPMHVYVGAQPNQTANIGQSIAISRVQVTGTTTPIDDSFNGGTLDPNVWQIAAADAAGIVVVPPDYQFWLSWTLPDAGFTVEAITPEVGNGQEFEPSGLTSPIQIGSRRWSLVPQSLEPFSGEGIFLRLKKAAPTAQ